MITSSAFLQNAKVVALQSCIITKSVIKNVIMLNVIMTSRIAYVMKIATLSFFNKIRVTILVLTVIAAILKMGNVENVLTCVFKL